MDQFVLTTDMRPQGDQPQAITKLANGLREGSPHQTLLGVTGSGKTFTMANVIAEVNRPALIISHNKTLAAQLFEEFKELFAGNAVEYFVSYYDYYQPEAYIPQRDIYIEKDASRNDELDRLRLSSTSSLVSRHDVVIVASVSCIFGLGSPEDYKNMVVVVTTGESIDRDEMLRQFIDLQYQRKDMALERGTFRVRGDVVEVYPAYEQFAYRIEMFGDEVERIDIIHPTTGDTLSTEHKLFLFPAVHYVMPEDRLASALQSISEELEQRLMELRSQGKLLEAQRLGARTRYDMEMLKEVGFCPGIENYSRHLSGLAPGTPPYTLINYFPGDYLLIIDESHVTLPQLKAMYQADRHRKEVLVDHGFRLPSALDNRPLRFEEFQQLWNQVIFVSATPAPYELELCGGEVVEQIIRPTGLIDPEIHVVPARGQVQHLLGEIATRVARDQRVLVTTLTKRMAEDLSSYISQENIRCRYLHSEIETLERVEILRDLRMGEFDVLVGVNLLREGLDLPEVSLVAIMDADKEGFLRSETSLIQMIGRTARNVDAKVFLYADRITPSMQRAIDETNRRRTMQMEYNEKHGITPETIRKEVRSGLEQQLSARRVAREAIAAEEETFDRTEMIEQIKKQMLEAAEALEFERAAQLRDRLQELEDSPELVTTTGAGTSGSRSKPAKTTSGRKKSSRNGFGASGTRKRR